MAISVFERRKFVRLDVALESYLNNEIKGVMKTLSLGGCSIETESPVHIDSPVCVKIFMGGESFEVDGDVLYSTKETSYAIRFNQPSNEQSLRLIKMIETIHTTSGLQRSARVSLQSNAVLDHESALITNISEGGCFIQTSSAFNSNDIVEVRFKIKEEDLHLAGQVRWAEPKGIGIEFLSAEPLQISTIARYVSQKTTASPAFS